jgi:[ribosomal protein S5]-alanine N-acetyltransferase
MTRGWPVRLTDGRLTLRPLRMRDRPAWQDVRSRNAAWLRPWDATSPDPVKEPVPSFAMMVRHLTSEARSGRVMPFVVTYDGNFVGQLTIGGIAWGSLRAAHVGYWVDRDYAGRGIIPAAVALACDHCWFGLGLHRMEVNIRPENIASRRVVEKLGFREEGLRPRYLHIDGQWRDHLVYVLNSEDVPGGLHARWAAARPAAP